MKKRLIIIQGPTAVGKTELTVNLAAELRTEVINADSRQVYREMKIGTARPDDDEMKGIKHHLIAHLNIDQDYSAQQFDEDASRILAEKFETLDTMIISGGSGFYIKALVYGMDEIPEIPVQIREALNIELKKYGIEKLQKELKDKDPEYFEKVDSSNSQRLIRALEVIRHTHKPFSSFHKGKEKDHDFEIYNFALIRERSELYRRINERVDRMISDGLEHEAMALRDKSHFNALQTVGYKEFFDYFDGKMSRDECIEKIKTNTRRFAKRQITWLRAQKDIIWINLDLENDPRKKIRESINGLGKDF